MTTIKVDDDFERRIWEETDRLRLARLAFNEVGPLRLDASYVVTPDGGKVGRAFAFLSHGCLVLSSIEIYPDLRRQGNGSAFMTQLCAAADNNGWTIALTPDDYKGSSLSRLVKFYRRFGFVPNKGRKKDYSISEAMLRLPLRGQVGAVTKDWNNLPWEEVVMDPECPTAIWWEYARYDTLLAMRSPLYPILSLESPDKWTEVMADASFRRQAWDIVWREPFTSRLKYAFWADCIARFVPTYAKLRPKDKRVAQAVDVFRSYGDGRINEEELNAFQSKLERNFGPKWSKATDTEHVARYILRACIPHQYGDPLNNLRSALDGLYEEPQAEQEKTIEGAWEWQRLVEYLRQLGEVVGARHKKEIFADPQAKPEEILSKTKRHPEQALAHPNCPVDLWWQLAKDFPLEALQGPMAQLNLLDNPSRWADMELERAPQWIEVYAHKIAVKKNRMSVEGLSVLRRLLADYAEHVLPLFTREFPDDPRPQAAIDAARAHADADIQWKDLRKAQADAAQAAQDAENPARPTAATTAATTAAYAAMEPSALSLIKGLSRTASHAVFCAAIDDDDMPDDPEVVERAEAAEARESVWQWRRMLDYLLPSASVGARDRAEILADPKATDEEIFALSEVDPVAAISHPNCPTDIWWHLAVEYPLEAEESILFPMFRLEDPARWVALEESNFSYWMSLYIRGERRPKGKKPEYDRMLRLFAADCASRALPVFEAVRPGDIRPRWAIEEAYAYANTLYPPKSGPGSKRALKKATLSAYGAACEVGDTKAGHAARAADWASNIEHGAPGEFAHDAAYQADMALRRGIEDKSEERWQWYRLKEYLRGTARPLNQPQVGALSRRNDLRSRGSYGF